MQLQSEVFVLRHNFIDEADAIEFYEQAQRNPDMKLTDCMQKQAIELFNFKILVDPEFNIIDPGSHSGSQVLLPKWFGGV